MDNSETIVFLRTTTLSKPSYNAQGAFLINSEGSAYIPVLFKDEVKMKEFLSEVSWQDNLEGKPFEGYYNFKELFTLNAP